MCIHVHCVYNFTAHVHFQEMGTQAKILHKGIPHLIPFMTLMVSLRDNTHRKDIICVHAMNDIIAHREPGKEARLCSYNACTCIYLLHSTGLEGLTDNTQHTHQK